MLLPIRVERSLNYRSWLLVALLCCTGCESLLGVHFEEYRRRADAGDASDMDAGDASDMDAGDASSVDPGEMPRGDGPTTSGDAGNDADVASDASSDSDATVGRQDSGVHENDAGTLPSASFQLVSSGHDPQVAVNRHGDAAVVWLQKASSDPPIDQIWMSRFDGQQHQWLAPELVSDPASTTDESYPRVVIDDEGTVAVFWTQLLTLWARTWTMGKWHDAQLVAQNQFSGPLQVSPPDAMGRIVAVWADSESSTKPGAGPTDYTVRLLASRYTPAASTWEPYQPISQDGHDVTHWVQGTAPGGETFVVWTEVQDQQYEPVVAASLDVASGTWRAPVVVGNKQLGPESPLALAIAEIGDDVLTLWQQYVEGTPNNLWTNRSNDGVWSTPERPATAAIAEGSSPTLASGPGNGATALWLIHGSRQPGSATYDPMTSSWSSVDPVAPAGSQVASSASLAMHIDAQGGRLALWTQINSTKIEIGYNGAPQGTAWQASAARTIATDIPNPDAWEGCGEPVLAVGVPGQALIVWPARAGSDVEIRGQWVTY
ncbi:MAG: hypothetical protein QM778_16955 [Myxococcales bacterium]